MTAGAPFIDRNGRRGVLEAPPGPGRAVLRLESGERFEVPADLLAPQPDGGYRLDYALDAALAAVNTSPPAEAATPAPTTVPTTGIAAGPVLTVPIVEERMRVVGTRYRETGRVRVVRHVEEVQEAVDVPLTRETVDIERVPVNQFVDAPRPVREEGGVTIVPVYEEVLVVEKRLLLKEELRIVRRQTKEHVQQTVTLRRSHVTVERRGPDSAPQDGASSQPPPLQGDGR